MSESQAAQAAAQYIKDQVEVMKKYGESPKVSGPKYTSAVKATARTFEAICKTR